MILDRVAEGRFEVGVEVGEHETRVALLKDQGNHKNTEDKT